MIEPAKFPYYPLEKAFEKETKIIEEQGKKIEALKALTEEELKSIEGPFPKEKKKKTTDEIKTEIDEIKKLGTKNKQKDLKHKAGKYKYDFQQYETIRFFGESIHSGKGSVHKVDMNQTNLAENI